MEGVFENISRTSVPKVQEENSPHPHPTRYKSSLVKTLIMNREMAKIPKSNQSRSRSRIYKSNK
jgi:hypothetical protein